MDNNPGRQLRRVRENLRLKYRDVEELSQQIARQRDNHEFSVGLSRLADIESKGTLPSLYRLYSLCVIYGLKFETVLTWYGINLNGLLSDASQLSIRETRPVDYSTIDGTLDNVPLEIDGAIDFSKTVYLSEHVRKWGKLPLSTLDSLDLKHHRYAFIGTDDWSMYPILPPGSFIQIDERKKKFIPDGFLQEHDKPIHLVEHRAGFRCGWCSERNGLLVVQPTPASGMSVEIFRLPGEVDVIGQIVGVAKRLDQVKRRHTRS